MATAEELTSNPLPQSLDLAEIKLLVGVKMSSPSRGELSLIDDTLVTRASEKFFIMLSSLGSEMHILSLFMPTETNATYTDCLQKQYPF